MHFNITSCYNVSQKAIHIQCLLVAFTFGFFVIGWLFNLPNVHGLNDSYIVK